MSQTENAATKINPRAGEPAPPEALIDVGRLVTACYSKAPDPSIPLQRVAFGTSGHRGSSQGRSFNEAHVLAISQPVCGLQAMLKEAQVIVDRVIASTDQTTGTTFASRASARTPR